MEKTKGFKMCEEFAEKVRKEILIKTLADCKQYQTKLGKTLVIEDNSDEYKDILIHLCSIQKILDRTLGE